MVKTVHKGKLFQLARPAIFMHPPRTGGRYIQDKIKEIIPIEDTYCLTKDARKNLHNNQIHNFLEQINQLWCARLLTKEHIDQLHTKGFFIIKRTPKTRLKHYNRGKKHQPHTIKIEKPPPIDLENGRVPFISYDHFHILALKEFGLITDRLWDEAFKFGMVRHPVSRIPSVIKMFHRCIKTLSELKCAMYYGASHLPNILLPGEFLRDRYGDSIKFNPEQLGGFIPYFKQCCSWFPEDLTRMDYVGRFEDLKEAHTVISTHLRLPERHLLYKPGGAHNPSQKKHTFPSLDKETVLLELMSMVYRKDLEAFYTTVC